MVVGMTDTQVPTPEQWRAFAAALGPLHPNQAKQLAEFLLAEWSASEQPAHHSDQQPETD